MLRSLVGRALTVARAPAAKTTGQRAYVTRLQVDVMKKALKDAEMVVNPRTNAPEPQILASYQQKLRSDPLFTQLVNMIMRDGKKALAERLVYGALLDIRKHTNKDPFMLVSDAINLVSPLMDTKSGRQGSKVIQVPRALNLRQRRRRAIVWLLHAVNNRNERSFSMRLSGELQAIVNGTSGVLEKKLQLHKFVLDNRSNIRTTQPK
ncbi:hypothetical protein IWW42_005009 [Coemansia sp. RSA 1085]|nr:hypothetical protein IWW42_005009 [Coemansia sp. RSA 1085]